MFSTVIPVQGTFDIAKGRNLLRSHIAEQHWPTTTNVRAAALLTALGDLIVPACLDFSVPIHVEFAPDGSHRGIHVSCEVPECCATDARMVQVQEALRQVTDHLLVDVEGGTVYITAYLHV